MILFHSNQLSHLWLFLPDEIRTGQALGSTAFQQFPSYYDLVRRRCLMPSRHACSLFLGEQGNSDFSCSLHKPAWPSCQLYPGYCVTGNQGVCHTWFTGATVMAGFQHLFFHVTRLPSLVQSIQLDQAHLQKSLLLLFLIVHHQGSFRPQQHKVVCKLLRTVVH